MKRWRYVPSVTTVGYTIDGVYSQSLTVHTVTVRGPAFAGALAFVVHLHAVTRFAVQCFVRRYVRYRQRYHTVSAPTHYVYCTSDGMDRPLTVRTVNGSNRD